MHRITLLCIGKLKTPWLKQGIEEYAERITHQAQFEVVELPDSRESDPTKQRADESARLLEAAAKRGGAMWALDETGTALTSKNFAVKIQSAADAGTPILFVLGGAYGLDDSVRAKADAVIRVSDMTFPHEICRLVFVEQLYRAQQINAGSGYHH